MFNNAMKGVKSLQEDYKNLENPSFSAQTQPKSQVNKPVKKPSLRGSKDLGKKNTEEEKKTSTSKPKLIQNQNGSSLNSGDDILKAILTTPMIPFIDKEKFEEAKQFFKINEDIEPSQKLSLISCFSHSIRLTNNMTVVLFQNKDERESLLQKNEIKSKEYKNYSFEEKLESWFDGKNPKEVVGENLVFDLNSRDFQQGRLGDCYLISTLKACTFYHLDHLVKEKGISKSGFYAVSMFRDGKFSPTIVSNILPELGNALIFNNKSFAFAILEKAYASLYGGYQAIDIGFSINSIRDITGLPASYIDLKDFPEALKKIEKSLQSGKILIASSKKVLPENSKIQKFHSYAIIKVQSKGGHSVLKLLDPTNRSYDKRTFPGFDCEADKGEVWLTDSEFQSLFEVVTMGSQAQKFCRSEYEIPSKKCVFRITIFGQGFYTFSLYQEFRKEAADYFLQRLFVGNTEKAECEFGLKRNVDVSFNCKPGNYLLCADSNIRSTLVITGAYPAFIEKAEIEYETAFECLIDVHSQFAAGNIITDPLGGEVRIRNGKAQGLTYYHYTKDEKSPLVFLEKLTISQSSNFFYKDLPVESNSTFEIELSPGSKKIVYFTNGKSESGSYEAKTSRMHSFSLQDFNEQTLLSYMKEIGTTKKRYDEVTFTSLNFDNPIVFHFSNKGKGVYEETMTFTFSNLKITTVKNCVLEDESIVKIKVPATDSAFFLIQKNNPFEAYNMTFKSNFKYLK